MWILWISIILSLASVAQADDASPSPKAISDWSSCGGIGNPVPGNVSFNDTGLSAVVCLSKTQPQLASAMIRAMLVTWAEQPIDRMSTEQLGAHIEFYHTINDAKKIVDQNAQPINAPTIVNEAQSRVRLTECREQHDIEEPRWLVSMSWIPEVPVTAIKVRLESQDPFGVTLQTDDYTPQGTFLSNVTANGSWTIGDFHMPGQAQIGRIRCTIIAVNFANGTSWIAPPLKTPKPVAGR